MKNNRNISVVLAILVNLLCMQLAYASKHNYKILTPKQKAEQRQKFVSKIMKHTQPVRAKYAYKTTTEIAERLIAQSDYGNFPDSVTYLPVFGLLDSFSFNYTSDRSSYFNYNFMKYDNTYQINGNSIFGFGSSVGFLDHNDLPDMLSDTSLFWLIDPYTLIYGLNEIRYSIYDTNNNIADFADYYTFNIGWRYVNTYDVYTNISTSLSYMLDTPTWDSSEYRLFTYNSLNLLVMDSTNLYTGGGIWSPEEKYIYTYDTSNNMIQVSYYLFDSSSGIWSENYRFVMTYYTDNKIQTLSEYLMDTGTLYLNTIDSFGWTSGLYYITYLKEANYNFDSLLEYYVYTKHVATDSLPDTMYATYFDPFGVPVNKQRTWYIYDSYSEPTLAMNYMYNDTTGLFDSLMGITHYYYQTYAKHHPSNVNNIAPPTETIKVYPNPATNELNIYRPNAAKGAYTFIKLINAAGQTVRTESLPWLSATETISTAGLTPGIYWLTIQDKAGNTLCRQAIVKQ